MYSRLYSRGFSFLGKQGGEDARKKQRKSACVNRGAGRHAAHLTRVRAPISGMHQIRWREKASWPSNNVGKTRVKEGGGGRREELKERRFGEPFGGRRFRLRRPCLLINNTISPFLRSFSLPILSPLSLAPPRPSLLLHAAAQG